ncbi:hypothetical protein ACEWY4_019837 [Coilia grayii]|uniref:UPAR/Ly6 domain-containing protein n=1 Tax=Coilia grayii TaxID=363190 RepID=A0ABD1JAW6_9TELE
MPQLLKCSTIYNACNETHKQHFDFSHCHNSCETITYQFTQGMMIKNVVGDDDRPAPNGQVYPHQRRYIPPLTIKMSFQITFIMMCLLFSQAEGLSCITCNSTSGSCSGSSRQCASSDLNTCGSITTVTSVGGTKNELNIKSCFRSSQCLNASLNIGTGRFTLSALCCSTDNCNTQDPPANGNSTSNGRQCFTCNVLRQSCSSRLDCVGDEDRCVSAKVEAAGQSVNVKGCVTRNVCSGAVASQLAVDLRCCEGNLCNGAWSVGPGASVLFLLWPLVSVLLLH